MNINNAFPSKYLKSGDLPENGDLALTIKEVSLETVGQDADAEQKPIVYFDETDKGMVLNKTNALTIANLYGPETSGWTGKRIALFATEVDFAGKQTLAIRVRLRAPAAPPNGNRRADLLARFEKLRDRAATLKLTHPHALAPMPAAASEADIVAAGKELKAAIEEAEKF